MKRLLFIMCCLLPCVAASAQAVQQNGKVTPGHATMWTTTGVIQDAGTSANGKLTSLGLTSTNLSSFCINNGPQTGPYSALCVGINGSTANIAINNFGGASAPTLLNLPGSIMSGPLTVPSINVSGGVTGFITLPHSSLPPVTSANWGQLSIDSACKNGTETSGTATSCIAYVNKNGAWTDVPYPPNFPVTIGGLSLNLVPGGSVAGQGNGTSLLTATGSFTSGHCLQVSSGGAASDAGAACGSGGGGSGTVTPGTANQIAIYPSSGTAVAGLGITNNAVVVTNGSGVPSEATTLPSSLTIPSPLITTGLTLLGNSITGVSGNGAKIQLETGTATSGHCVQFDANGNVADAGGACTTTGASGTVTSSTANQLAYYQTTGTAVQGLTTANNAVLVTNGSGVPSESTTLPSGLTVPSGAFTTAMSLFGTSTTAVQGNGAKIQLSTGSPTSGHCAQFDANANVVDAGGTCTTGGGGGTVTSGTANQLTWYQSSGTTVVGLTTANNGVLVTNGSGTPSIATTLPSSLTIPSASLTTATSLFGTSVSAVQGAGAKVQLSTGTTTTGHCVQYDSTGNTIDSGVACAGGTGVVASGTINDLGFYASSSNTISPLATANNGLLVTNGTGVPSISTTTPSGLTIPSPSISTATLTGTTTSTGAVVLPGSTTSITPLTIPAGATPTSPPTGGIWTNAGGTATFIRLNGSSQGIVTSTTGAPLSGTGAIGVSGSVVSCATCVTGTGGALTAAGINTITSGQTVGTISTSFPFPINLDSQFPVHNDTYYVPAKWTWATGSIGSFIFWTGGTNTPSFNVTFQVVHSGVATNVTGCTNIAVNATTNSSLATAGTATCTAANTLVSGDALALVISNTNGNPASAHIEPVLTHSNP